ncbi:MAG TPA: hypothetical protein VMW27_30695 [Thermoanaerobaculia bacterium]|nr:hypothetical protein [Thermoanaerobaculia bacterium]
MQRTPGRLAALAICGLTLAPFGLTGCRERPPEPAAQTAATPIAPVANDAEWAWLQQTKRTLDEKRERLRQLRPRPQATPTPTPPPTPAGPPIEQLEAEVKTLSQELGRRLTAFLNADPPVQGEPMSERQQAALRMRSDEEILVARDFIERGGDFRRAIEIYETALEVDPDNQRLKEELERARGMRYMSRERFAQVQEGMTPDQVRALLGQPNRQNVRDYADIQASAWFYPKEASGAAAAVWFKKEGGRVEVYEVDFDAVQPGAALPEAAPRRPVGPQGTPAAPAPVSRRPA